MHIEIDSNRLYRRSFQDSMGKKIMMLCCNCFLNECFDIGCIGSTNDGSCECRLDHSC